MAQPRFQILQEYRHAAVPGTELNANQSANPQSVKYGTGTTDRKDHHLLNWITGEDWWDHELSHPENDWKGAE